jgi:hypothetical protein
MIIRLYLKPSEYKSGTLLRFFYFKTFRIDAIFRTFLIELTHIIHRNTFNFLNQHVHY